MLAYGVGRRLINATNKHPSNAALYASSRLEIKRQFRLLPLTTGPWSRIAMMVIQGKGGGLEKIKKFNDFAMPNECQ